MTLNQRLAWTNIVTASLWLIALMALFISGGTMLFWEIDSMRVAFLAIILVASLSASGLRAFVRKRSYEKKIEAEVITDERDNRIRKDADMKSGLWGLTTVFFGVLGLFFYDESTGGIIPAYFLFFPMLVGALTYLYSNGIYILILCNRKIGYDE